MPHSLSPVKSMASQLEREYVFPKGFSQSLRSDSQRPVLGHQHTLKQSVTVAREVGVWFGQDWIMYPESIPRAQRLGSMGKWRFPQRKIRVLLPERGVGARPAKRQRFNSAGRSPGSSNKASCSWSFSELLLYPLQTQHVKEKSKGLAHGSLKTWVHPALHARWV